MIHKEFCKIVRQKEIAKDIFELTIQGELVSEISSPGQFVHVKVGNGVDPLLRRPISISSYDKKNGLLTMVYRIAGKGTSLLAEMKMGQELDILGPLGNGFQVSETHVSETALLVGGGIGVPPLYELSKQLKAKGVKVVHVLGFQAANAVFYEQEFLENGETYITTVDGSYGTKGFVTDVIEEKKLSFHTLYACGPRPMLKALEERFPDKNVFLSHEERMACGIGACFACALKDAKDPSGVGYKRVCTEGPVFRAGEVIF